VKSRWRRGGEGEERRKEWKKRAEQIVGREKGNWGKRWLSRFTFEQNGQGR
jgi:hypothetical protein